MKAYKEKYMKAYKEKYVKAFNTRKKNYILSLV